VSDVAAQADIEPREAAAVPSVTAPVSVAPDPVEATSGAVAAPADASAWTDDREREHLRPHGSASPTPSSPARGGGSATMATPETTHATHEEQPRPTCTVAQLRRFIKSRPWVPMHELRRRFGINGDEDDVTPIVVGGQRLYIGLPGAEGRLIAELLSGGDVGYELSLDPTVPIVVGVYPMRPVPRS
jgi:hypothetical protein